METHKARILCVDDDPTNLHLLAGELAPQGYEVLMAGNGVEALALVKKRAVDLILLDVMLPGMTGYEVCAKIKEDERYRHVPVIMLTGLGAKEDRIKGIEAGAQDFLTKPFDFTELLARIKMLLRIKTLDENLMFAYEKITALSQNGEDLVSTFDPLNFDFSAKLDDVVDKIIRKTPDNPGKPQIVIVGIMDGDDRWVWQQYEAAPAKLQRRLLKQLDLHHDLGINGQDGPNGERICFYNEDELADSRARGFADKMAQRNIKVANLVGFVSRAFCILALNYRKKVSRYDAEVIRNIALQSLFLKSLSSQVQDTEKAFDYLVFSLARAAEANDEDTGNHILRVGEYCALLAVELGLPEKFVSIIRTQATLHDVGKIHVHPDILKKPGRLTAEEFEDMKKHTTYGGKIMGDHVRLTLAKKAALTHHERWDGSGYPHGLKGEQIPLEGRILNIADQYDALRNKRVYKPGFDHQTTLRILTEGDDRTLPLHFDPEVHRAFKATATRFDEVYEKMKG
jgi:response regulator RpfG family c-di-GMP phosphodiesterase